MAYQSNQDTQSAGKGYFPLRNSAVTSTVVKATPRYRVSSKSSLPVEAKLDSAVVSKCNHALAAS